MRFRRGARAIPTAGITPWMLGGVAECAAPFETPGAEARVALAGRAVTAVLGAGLVAARLVAGLPAPGAAVLEWLGWTNLLLLASTCSPPPTGVAPCAGDWRLRRSHLRAKHDAARLRHARRALARSACRRLARWRVGGGALGRRCSFSRAVAGSVVHTTRRPLAGHSLRSRPPRSACRAQMSRIPLLIFLSAARW